VVFRLRNLSLVVVSLATSPQRNKASNEAISKSPISGDTNHHTIMIKRWSTWSSTKSSRPAHHGNDAGTTFINPWPSASAPTWGELVQVSFPLGFYENLAKKHPGITDVKVVSPDWGASTLKDRGLKRDNCIVATTLGHAGAITELPLEGTGKGGEKKSFWIVYDPIFSLRAGPTQYTGPQRMRAPPCQVTDLPGKDLAPLCHELLTN
jgi:N-acyl-phosphatidylethanolamine-hydrolysing phospholipase D